MFDDYIFVQPSFLRGVARALDIGGTLDRAGGYLVSGSPIEADARALASDFRVTNRDLHAALGTLEREPEEAAGK